MTDDKRKIAGQVTSIAGRRVAVVGGTMADILNLDNWTETRDGKVVNPGKPAPEIIIDKPRRKPTP